MLDLCADQGVGLRHIGMTLSTRVIAVTSHGNHDGELPLLWSLCSALVQLGYPVTVLDATTEESKTEPGLEQILDEAYWQRGVQAQQASWSILPAAKGLQVACQTADNHASPLNALSGIFDPGQVVIIFAYADLLSRLLGDTGVEPVLAVSDARISLMTAYRSLKQMLLEAGVHPLVVTIGQEPLPDTPPAGPMPGENLLDCARTFLDCNLRPPMRVTLDAQEKSSPEIAQLVTKMLETAMSLNQNTRVTRQGRDTHTHEQFSGSH